MKGKHTFDSVIRSLSKKGILFVDGKRTLVLNYIEKEDDDIKVVQKKKNLFGRLVVVNNAHDVGNGSWGKIDYLCEKHNYRIYGLKTLQQLNLIR